MNPVIRISECTVSCGANVALKDVTLEIARGEFVTVIGPNGAGKTTLLTLINGLRTVSSGNVEVFGERLGFRNAHRIRRRIGYVPQIPRIDPMSPISVRDVVMIGRSGVVGMFRRTGQRDRDVVKRALDTLGISTLAERPIGHLSGGEQQKVSVARALAQEPEILLLDEPTANLDLTSQRELMESIETIYARNDLTVVFVTHLLSRLPVCMTRVVLMKGGRIVLQGAPGDVLSNDVLEDLYGSSLRITRCGKRYSIQPGW